MRRVRIVLSVLVLALHVISGGLAYAQGNGAGVTKLLLPFEGGSGRPVAESLAESARVLLGRTVVVENKPGASGRIAAMALKRAAPDGTTIAQFPIVVPVIGPLSFKEVHYTSRDFVPISQIATYDLALAVPNSHPARSVAELVDWLKKNPAQRFYGSPGAGTLPHFLGVMIGKAIETDMTHVPYKGLAAMMIDLVEGTIPCGISVVSDLIDMHRAGRIRILATSGEKRLSQLPEVATFSEQGYPGVVASGWVGIFAPAGTPRAIVNEWSAALVTTTRSPRMRQKLIDFGVEPTGTSPDEFAAIVDADIARWAPIIKLSGFQAE